jgi:succinate dehydrogenase/fumarate reductase cytochrome b subunit
VKSMLHRITSIVLTLVYICFRMIWGRNEHQKELVESSW